VLEALLEDEGAACLAYSDPAAESAGVTKIAAKGGDAGKGKVSVAGRNKASKGQTALPALAAGLAGGDGRHRAGGGERRGVLRAADRGREAGGRGPLPGSGA